MIIIVVAIVGSCLGWWKRIREQISTWGGGTQEDSEKAPLTSGGLAQTNLPHEDFLVSSPLSSFSVPSVSTANLPRRFVFPEPRAIDDSFTSDEPRRPLTCRNQPLPTDLAVKVKVDTLVCRRYDQATEPCYCNLAINLLYRTSEHRRFIRSPSCNQRQIFFPSSPITAFCLSLRPLNATYVLICTLYSFFFSFGGAKRLLWNFHPSPSIT